LTACLTYLDFFPTSTQRTAVTTAANCCRNIPDDSFPVIRDVMPILLNVLQTHDQKVVEQGCLCVSRIVESFKFKPERLEELVSPDLLRAILRLLLPGTTNLIGPNIHTQFLRVLSITALASPQLSVELLKMNVVDTLYQILTGVSPPSNTEDVASKIDSVIIMQALIHRPREQVFETLNVICELLPGVPSRHGAMFDSDPDIGFPGDSLSALHSSTESTSQKRVELLNECKQETKRFAMILLPTLTDAYSSTVNLSVRQKVITAQLKMLSNLDTQIIEDALRAVPYASFLASILSQQDHASLVHYALQAAELLLDRLPHIYQYQFYREGVITEIKKLADRPLEGDELQLKHEKSQASLDSREAGTESHTDPDNDENMDDDSSDDDDDDGHEDEDGVDEDHDEDRDDMSRSASSSSSDEDSIMLAASSVKDLITMRAKKLLETHQSTVGQEKRDQASKILLDLQTLAKDIEDHYVRAGLGDGAELFSRLATYFDGDAIESITSSELLNSGVVRALLEVFNTTNGFESSEAKMAFLAAFTRHTKSSHSNTSTTETPSTPFGVLVHKLQDLLSRSEHFEVITVHSSSDSSRSSAASMLAKQLRLKLIADDDSDIPRPYRNIMVSIHAIATFKALDDYLRPRISLSERPRGSRHRDAMSSTLAAYASAARLRDPHDRLSDSMLFGGGGEPPTMPPSGSAPGGRKKISSKSKINPPSPAQESRSSASRDKASSSRRSSRRNPPKSSEPPQDEASSQPLECADERHLSDDDEGDDGPLDAIVDDLDDDMSDEDLIDTAAVNMEIASTGKVTARKEDGTRVATPNQSSTPVSRPSSSAQPSISQPPAPSLALAGRPYSSYAAAMAAIPQDWHIEFSMDEKKVPHETTIYRAVYHNKLQPDDSAARNVWSAIHSIKFKRVRGPPPVEPSSISPVPEPSPEPTASGMPVSLDKNAITSSILKLLSLLYDLNANLDDLFTERKEIIPIKAEPLAQFINTKLTAKMNRQLEEPLIVASNCLPAWSEDLARLFPFLFPFETRHLFLQSTSYGYSRSMQRWQNSQSVEDERRDRRRDDRPFLGRLQRQKVRISRTRILESAVKVMELYGASPSVLEVEFFDEVGTGLGPTLEFYSTVSKEFSKKKLKLWRENDSNDRDEFAFGKLGLFPAPMSEEQANHENGKRVLHLFKMLGKFVARAMLDSRIVDVSFNPTFFRVGEGTPAVNLSLGTVKSVDSDLARSLMVVKEYSNVKKKIEENGQLTAAQKVHAMYAIEIYGTRIEDLGLDFTLPGYPTIELVAGGSNLALTIDNVDLYLEKVIDFTLGSGVRYQIDAFRTGFTQVFPYQALRAFTPAELVMLFGRTEEDWSIESEFAPSDGPSQN
jgi:E3 ubiquitin-protein ligase TRIP12